MEVDVKAQRVHILRETLSRNYVNLYALVASMDLSLFSRATILSHTPVWTGSALEVVLKARRIVVLLLFAFLLRLFKAQAIAKRW